MTPQLISKKLDIPQQHPCFADHFPGNPVVPGALLLQWIFELIDQEINRANIQGLKSLKFISAAKPGDSCDVQLEIDRAQGKIKIQCLRQDSLLLKGVLGLNRASPDESAEQ